jgi:hypothetical protein
MTKQDVWWDCPAPLDSNLHKVQVFWATHKYREARQVVDEDAGKTLPEACVDDVILSFTLFDMLCLIIFGDDR